MEAKLLGNTGKNGYLEGPLDSYISRITKEGKLGESKIGINVLLQKWLKKAFQKLEIISFSSLSPLDLLFFPAFLFWNSSKTFSLGYLFSFYFTTTTFLLLLFYNFSPLRFYFPPDVQTFSSKTKIRQYMSSRRSSSTALKLTQWINNYHLISVLSWWRRDLSLWRSLSLSQISSFDLFILVENEWSFWAGFCKPSKNTFPLKVLYFQVLSCGCHHIPFLTGHYLQNNKNVDNLTTT